jgi:hypothetical protein
MAQMNMKLEIKMALEVDHSGMAIPSGDIQTLSKVADFIATCVRATQTRISAELQTGDFPESDVAC